MTRCSICEGDFDISAEGGCEGEIGILPVAFCVWCRAGIFDLAEQMRLPVMCPGCGWCEGDDE